MLARVAGVISQHFSASSASQSLTSLSASEGSSEISDSALIQNITQFDQGQVQNLFFYGKWDPRQSEWCEDTLYGVLGLWWDFEGNIYNSIYKWQGQFNNLQSLLSHLISIKNLIRTFKDAPRYPLFCRHTLWEKCKTLEQVSFESEGFSPQLDDAGISACFPRSVLNVVAITLF